MSAISGQRRESLIDVDTANFEASLEKAFAEMQIESATKLQKVANDVAKRAKELAPVATGRLRASIAATPVARDEQGPFSDVGTVLTGESFAYDARGRAHVGGKFASKAQVAAASGSGVDYAPYVEFGTSRMRPQPFMRPALAEVIGGDFERLHGERE